MDIGGLVDENAIDQLRHLLAARPSLLESLDPAGWTPLGLAVEKGRLGIMRMLLELGANAAALSGTGDRDPLLIHICATGCSEALPEREREEDLAMVQLLLDGGAYVDVRSARGETPLIVASSSNKLMLGRMLLKRGADPNAETVDGETPLSYCCVWGYVDFAALLLKCGGRRDWRDRYGHTLTDLASDAPRSQEILAML